jgi:SAM-dependent methyltransferase
VFWTRLSRWVNGGDQAAARNLPALIALARELRRRPRVLVVGGGAIAYGSERLYTDPEVDLVAFDIYVSPQVQLVADAHAMPFKDGSFDAVAIQAVLEHVLDPRQVVAEIRRVLRDDGLVYAETPFLQQVHEGAFDFQRYTERGHRWLFRDFAQIATGEVAGAGTATFWSVRYLIGGLVRSRRIGNLIAAPLFVLRFLDLLVAPGHGLDASSATYFLGRKASRAIDAAELARGFRGAR